MEKQRHFFVELREYDRDALSRANLIVPKDDADDALDRVIANLRAGREGRPKLLRRDDLGYSFDFVGLVYCGGFLFAVLPKYLGSSMNNSSISVQGHLRLVLEVIEKYYKKLSFETARYQLEGDKERSFFGQLNLWKMIIDDYIECGPYDNDETRFVINGNGEIDWGRTFDRIDPWVTDDRIVFIDTVNREKKAEVNNPVRIIQEAVINEIVERLANCGLREILDFPEINLPPVCGTPLKDSMKCVFLLEKERRSVFSTRKRRLLTALIDYLDEAVPQSSEKELLCFGTSEFNMVWESVCRDVFAGEETGKYIEKIDRVKWRYLAEILSEDKLEYYGIGGKTDETGHPEDDVDSSSHSRTLGREKGRPKPDVVSLKDDRLYILDAKYYCPQFDEDGISGQPGLGDITKQYLYQAALFKQYAYDGGIIKSKPPCVINAFLIPTVEKKAIVSKRGDARLPFMEQLCIMAGNDPISHFASPIHLLELNSEEAYKSFLGRGRNSNEFIEALNEAIHAWCDNAQPRVF